MCARCFPNAETQQSITDNVRFSGAVTLRGRAPVCNLGNSQFSPYHWRKDPALLGFKNSVGWGGWKGRGREEGEGTGIVWKMREDWFKKNSLVKTQTFKKKYLGVEEMAQ